eukprot:3816770-Pyramimonas_sp.AAC.1
MLALCDEGNAWTDGLDGAAGTHATIWRQIKAVAGRRRPRFLWVPSHKTVEEYGQLCIPQLFCLGNGALEHRVNKGHGDVYQAEFKRHQGVAKYNARAMHRMRTVGGWDPEHQCVPLRAPSFPLPQVTVVEHLLVRLILGLSYAGRAVALLLWRVGRHWG